MWKRGWIESCGGPSRLLLLNLLSIGPTWKGSLVLLICCSYRHSMMLDRCLHTLHSAACCKPNPFNNARWWCLRWIYEAQASASGALPSPPMWKSVPWWASSLLSVVFHSPLEGSNQITWTLDRWLITRSGCGAGSLFHVFPGNYETTTV